jgi:hypothetical protein
MQLFVNDTLKPNAGQDQVLCFNDMLNLSATGLDTVKNKKSGTYIWYRGLPIPSLGFSTKQKVSFTVQKSESYVLKLEVKEDTTVCFLYDTTDITVNPLPKLNAHTTTKILLRLWKHCLGFGGIRRSNWRRLVCADKTQILLTLTYS